MKFQIENYESMTPEEKVAALESYEPDMSGWVAKSVADKHASEAADYKKKWREAVSEDEAKKAQDAEERATLLARVEQLEKEKAVSTYIAAYTAMGYDENLAKSSAEALVKGDTETLFANQKLHNEKQEKALRAELLKQTPPPAAGKTETSVDKNAFAKLSLADKQKFAAENPEVYASFYE